MSTGIQPKHTVDSETERDRLRTEAQQRWGDDWALRITEWADGTTRMVAYHMRGRVRDGDYVERDELKFTPEGELIVERVHVVPEERGSLGLIEV